MKLKDYAIQSIATKPIPAVLTIVVERDLAALLSELAAEHDETPEQLFVRLVQKEHFERHAEWVPLLGECTPKVCMSQKCFMQQGSEGKR